MSRAVRTRGDDVSRIKAAVLVFACALGVRLLCLLIDRPDFASEYWDLASSLRRYGTLGWDGVPTTLHDPLHPIFLAVVRGVVGDRRAAVQLIQLAIAATAPVCLYYLTDALTARRRAALFAGLMFACYPLSVRHAADAENAALMGTLLIVFCLTFVRAATAAGAVWAGLWLGLAALTRTMALPLVVLAALAWALQGRWREACALAVTALALFAPYARRNHALNGAVLPTRSGLNLFVSTTEYTAAIVPEYHPDLLVPYATALLAREQVPLDSPATPAFEREADVRLKRYAWANVARHPARQLWLRVRYIGYLFSPFLVPSRRGLADPTDVHLGPDGQVTITGDTERQPLWNRAIYTASYAPVLALAVIGAVLRRHRVRADAILWSVAATYVAAHAVFFPAPFYRMPMEFVLLFFAAVAVDRVAPRMCARPARRSRRARLVAGS